MTVRANIMLNAVACTVLLMIVSGFLLFLYVHQPRSQFQPINHRGPVQDWHTGRTLCSWRVRRQHLVERCQAGPSSPPSLSRPSQPLPTLLLMNRKRGVAACWSPLLGDESWIELLDPDVVVVVGGADPGSWIARQHHVLAHLQVMHWNQIQSQIKDYKLLLLVQNPVSRLVKTLADLGNPPHSSDLVEMLRSLDSIAWRPVSNICSVCSVPYNHILRLETFKTDVAAILNSMDLSYQNYMDRVNDISSNRAYKLPRNFPPRQLQAIKYIYQQDFQYFGYDINNYSKELTCEMRYNMSNNSSLLCC